jgi:transporter family-2 protein
MNPSWLSLVLIVLAGGATALQAPTNAKLMSAVGSPVNAAFISFAVGTLALGLAAAVMHVRPDGAAVRGLPAWAWVGGLYGCIFVIAAAWSVPRYGAALTITLMVAGQLIISLLLDATGAFGVTRQPISLSKIAGVVLVLAGVALARRG